MLSVNADNNSDRTSIVVSDDHEVSMKVIQNFYAKVTGKKEQLSKFIQFNHRTNFDDLENLHVKITQVCGPLTVVQRNESVVVYHVNESKDQFSSFDSFRRYNKSLVSPVENVNIEYNILITQPGLSDVQNYKIVIDIHSRAGILQKASGESGSMPNFIYQMMAKNTGNVKINYVDYVVAINFLIAIDLWFQSLPQEKNGFFLSFCKKISHNFPFIFRYLSVSVFLSVCYYYFQNINYDNSRLLGLMISVFGFAYVLGGLSSKLGEWMESSVDSIYPLSYVSLNRGDENVVAEHIRRNKRGYLSAFAFCISGLAINIVSSVVAVWIGIE